MTTNRIPRALLATTVVTFAAATAPASAPQAPACDTAAIEWVLPGHFEQALERARAERRMLLIKGISFGVDEAGATCANRGVW